MCGIAVVKCGLLMVIRSSMYRRVNWKDVGLKVELIVRENLIIAELS